MSQKLFSIITPTYNCGAKLRRTIESVLAQRADLFEFIIVDGVSTDGTADLVKQFAGRLSFISEKDEGVYDALNKGVALASGKYLYFLGAGDCLRKDILAQLEAQMPDDELTFVYGMIYLTRQHKNYPREFTRANIRSRNIYHQSIFYGRGIFEIVGNYELKYRLLADWVLNLKCFADDRIEKKYVAQVIADYEGGGLSETQTDDNFVRDFPRLIKTHLGARHYLLYKSVDALRAYLHLHESKLLRFIPDEVKSSLPFIRRKNPYRAPELE